MEAIQVTRSPGHHDTRLPSRRRIRVSVDPCASESFRDGYTGGGSFSDVESSLPSFNRSSGFRGGGVSRIQSAKMELVSGSSVLPKDIGESLLLGVGHRTSVRCGVSTLWWNGLYWGVNREGG